MDTSSKVRENKARRVLDRRGYVLYKSRRRDPHAIDYGGYMIADSQTQAVVAGADPRAFSLTLEDVEAFIEARASSKAG